jgi:hypothetical protein
VPLESALDGAGAGALDEVDIKGDAGAAGGRVSCEVVAIAPVVAR